MGCAKLNKRKINYIIRAKTKGQSYKQIARDLKISVSTVKRVWIHWLNYGEPIEIKRSGRKMLNIDENIEKIILSVHNEQKLGAVRLEKIIETKYGIHIPHNTIHRILLKNGKAREEINKKKRRKKWIRYERKHSLSMVHLDWHSANGKNICVALDDSSRMILSGGEFEKATEENSIMVVKEAIDKYGKIGVIKEVLTDRGSQFYVNKKDEKGEGENKFEEFLRENNIKHIVSRVNHPQTNGKLEKWFDLYDKHRNDFETFEEFVEWYNTIRYHQSLDTKYYLQTPKDAFWTRLPEECKLGMFYELVEGEKNGQ